MSKSLECFLTEAGESVRKFDEFVQKRGLNEPESVLTADHICYKCGSRESFEGIRAWFEGYSDFIYQAIISSRRIAYIKIPGAMKSLLGPIRYIELSDQKPDGSQKEGFDHIEVYPLYGDGDDAYERLVARLSKTDQVQEVSRPHHSTHDIDIGNGFIFRCSRGPLLHKIKSSEMI